MTEREIFVAALNHLDLADRAAFLSGACGNDDALRNRVESLLAEHEQLGSFMEAPTSTPTLDPPALKRIGSTIGPYKLLQQIGEGGMGVVYMAEQAEPVQRRVAIKIIKPGMDSRQVVARFEAERQALAMMDHPNIAKVLEAGTTESGRPYFVMELVRGVPITKYCDEKRLNLKERLELLIPVCQAIQHAHQKGIIHRDIKPNNVLVAQYDGKPVPKVIDFGVAKATAQKLTERTMFTELGQVIGTLEYMSPEQAELNQLDIDTRSDIYSLGVLLYELLTGTTPFDKQKLRTAAFHEMLRIIREDEPPRPSTNLSTSGTLPSIAANRQTEPARLSKAVRGELDWIVMKALEKDRSRRYETANGLAMDIQRYLDDEHVQACPPSARYRFGKFARKNGATLTTAALIFATLLIGIVISVWQAVRAIHAERLAGERLIQVESQRRRAQAGETLATNRLIEVDRQRKQAEQNLESALGAVDLLLAQVGKPEMGNVPRIQPIRRQMLQEAIKFYEQFAVDTGNSPELSQRAGMTWHSIASLCNELGDHEAGDRAHKSALSILGKLVAESPERSDFRESLARAQVGAGFHYQWAVRDYDQAIQLFEESSDTFAALAAVQPPRKHLLVAQAHALRGLARVQFELGKPAEAIAHAKRSLELFDEPGESINRGIVLQDLAEYQNQSELLQADAYYQRALAEFRNSGIERRNAHDRGQYGQLLLKMARRLRERDPSAAESHLREGIALYRQLWADVPTSPHPRNFLAHCLREQAMLLLRKAADQRKSKNELSETAAQQAAQAEEMYNEALTIRRQLVSEFTTNQEYQSSLEQVLTELAEVQRAAAEAEAEPQSAAEYVQRGQRYRTAGRYEDALSDLQGAVELEPDNWEGHRELVWLFNNNLRKPQQALEHANRLMAIAPDRAASWHAVGAIYESLGDHQRAIEHATRAIEMGPTETFHYWEARAKTYRSLKEYDKALSDYNVAIRLSPNSDSVYYWRAVTYEMLHEYEKALADYSDSIRLNPKSARVYAGRAALHKNQGRPAAAAADFQKALQFDPDNYGYHHELVWLFRQLRRARQAREHAERLVVLAPEMAASWHALASTEKDFREFQQAKEHADRAIELGPSESFWYWLNRAQIYQGLQENDKALADMNAAIQLAPRSAEGYLRRAALRRQLGDEDQAVADYKRAAEFVSTASEHNAVAWALVTAPNKELHDPTTGLAHAQKAVELAPTTASFWNTLGVAQYRAGDWKAAITALEKGMELPSQGVFTQYKGGDSFDWLFLAMAHWQLGNKEEARKWFDKAVAWMEWNQPKNEELLRFRAEAKELLGIQNSKITPLVSDSAPEP